MVLITKLKASIEIIFDTDFGGDADDLGRAGEFKSFLPGARGLLAIHLSGKYISLITVSLPLWVRVPV